MNRQQPTRRGVRGLSNTHVPVRGCTLVELMIVSVLLVILGGAFITTFLSGQTSYLTADAYITVQQEARRGFDYMVRELRQSGTIYQTPAIKLTCGSTTVVTCPSTGTPPSQQINFEVAMNYAGGIQWGNADPGNTNGSIHYAIVQAPAPNPNNEYKLIRFITTSDSSVPVSQTVAGCTPPNCRILANYVNLGSAGSTQSGFLVNGSVITLQLQLLYRSPLRPTQSMGAVGVGSTTQPLVAQVELRNP